MQAVKVAGEVKQLGHSFILCSSVGLTFVHACKLFSGGLCRRGVGNEAKFHCLLTSQSRVCVKMQAVEVACAGEVLALGHSKEAELLPAPAVIGEAVILKDQLPAAAFRPCTFRHARCLGLPCCYMPSHVLPCPHILAQAASDVG